MTRLVGGLRGWPCVKPARSVRPTSCWPGVTTRLNITWAVGGPADSAGQATLIEHYTGWGSFTDLGGPNVAGTSSDQLLAIAAVPGSESDVWAVGSGGNQPLILHHSP